MRDPESQTPATTPGLQGLSHYHGSRRLKPVPLTERKGSENTKQPPDTGVSGEKLRGMVRWIGDKEWEVHRSPRASSPEAVSYHDSSCLLPSPVPERNGSGYCTLPPDYGVSAEKLTGKVGEVGDTEPQAAPPGAM